MNSITIEHIDDELEQRLKALASRDDLNLDQLVEKLLRERLGLQEPQPKERADFEGFFGSWSEDEFQDFERATAAFSTVDEEMWK